MFQKFRVSKNVVDKRGLGVPDFPSKLICLTVPKHFVREAFYAAFQKYSGNEKILPKKGKSRFSIEVFLSHKVKKSRRGTLLCCVSEIFRQRIK